MQRSINRLKLVTFGFAVVLLAVFAFLCTTTPATADASEKASTANIVDKNAKTAVDWFKSRGSDKAVDAIMTSKYASYTNVGSMYDATALENMRQSLVWLKEFNQKYRKDLGLKELRVNDYLMACAMADANYSDKHVEHAQQFSVGENLSWGYIDPYDGWYHREKALYDQDPEGYDSGKLNWSDVGHYKNIINPDYTLTGFGINYNCTNYGSCMSQTFDMTNDESDPSLKSYSVDEYYTEFMKYFEKYADGPVYRLYNQWTGEHHFTVDKSEYDKCVKDGWTGEDVKFYSDGDIAVYRLYNPYEQAFYHHYTSDKNERQKCIKDGWVDEEIGWYGR